MAKRVPAIFVNAVAGGDERWASVLWTRPVRRLGNFTPQEYWEQEGVLTKAVRQQMVVRVLRELNGMPVAQRESLAPDNGAYAFDADNGITLDGLALGTPVIRTPRPRTLPNYRPRPESRGKSRW